MSINPKLQLAAQAIKDGNLVAFPTETVYGLGANALNAQAVQKIFLAKGRPSDNPLIVHISQREKLDTLVTEVTPEAEKLMQHFWPGPLTLVFPARSSIPAEVTAGGRTVAVRMPNHPVALALIKEAGVPLAAPSANKSGRPSPTTAEHVVEDFTVDEVPIVLDAGPCRVGLESTVVDATTKPVTILRLGGISKEELEEVVGPVQLAQPDAPVTSPGMKYRHYAPQGKVEVVEVLQLSDIKSNSGQKTAVLQLDDNQQIAQSDNVDLYFSFGGDITAMAAGLYWSLRECDAANIDIIFIEAVPPVGLGRTIMDRVRRAGNTAQLPEVRPHFI